MILLLGILSNIIVYDRVAMALGNILRCRILQSVDILSSSGEYRPAHLGSDGPSKTLFRRQPAEKHLVCISPDYDGQGRTLQKMRRCGRPAVCHH